MGWDDDYEEPDGTCESCGIDLDDDPDGDHDEHHRQCWACWRGDGAEGETPIGVSRNGVPSPAPAFPGDERWKVAYLRGYREGWAAAKADKAA
jgi:hypothetical protein